MAITRDSLHKRRATGGRRSIYKKKRKYETGRPPAMTKLGDKKIVKTVRTRGGNVKHRALRLQEGNFSWGTEVVAKKVRILDVVYNASNNELVRTKTLVKGSVVSIDAAPFRKWFETRYFCKIGNRGEDPTPKPQAKSNTAKARHAALAGRLDKKLQEQLATGRILAMVSSRPGQSGRADGYILEDKELDFYLKASSKKK